MILLLFLYVTHELFVYEKKKLKRTEAPNCQKFEFE